MEAYFYCDSYKIPDLAYHDYVCMAEGLLSLGIACFGDRNMYRPGEDEDFLIRQDRDHGIEKADLIFFHFLLYRQGNKVADKKIAAILDKVKPECKGIFIDSEDGVRTPGFEKELKAVTSFSKAITIENTSTQRTLFPGSLD